MYYWRKNSKINNQDDWKITEYYSKIQISKLNEIVLDGMFEICNFDTTSFNKEEVYIIYINTNDNNMKTFTQAIVEIKLNKNKFGELVSQLIKDKNEIEKLTEKKILYIGLINSKNINLKEIENSKKKLNNLNWIIFGINKSIFSGKNITKFYDWKLINNFNDFARETKEKFKLLENRLDYVEKRLDNVEKRRDKIEAKMEDFVKMLKEVIEKLNDDIGNKRNMNISVLSKKRK